LSVSIDIEINADSIPQIFMPAWKSWTVVCLFATLGKIIFTASPSYAVPPSPTADPTDHMVDAGKVLGLTHRVNPEENPQSKQLAQQPTTVPSNSSPIEPVANPVNRSTRKSPVRGEPFRLFGWETAQPIGKDQLFLEFGGTTFNNPYDFRGGAPGQTNRSNDAHLDVVYGITPDTQLSIGLSGKDDTVFSNLVRNNSEIQVISNTIPVQAKWRFYNSDRLQTAVVAGVEFSNPFSALFFRANREIAYSQLAANGVDRDRILASNNAPVFGIGFPVSYKASDNLSLHFNPRISVFPSKLRVTETKGDPTAIQNAGIGFDGQNLDYFGTVVGLGVGANYALSPSLQVAADYTQIVAGRNSIDQATNNSLLGTRPVWSAGVRYSPNERTAIGLSVTNRFNATSASPSNLLAQPGGDYGFGLSVAYVPDFPGEFSGTKRQTYPKPGAFNGPGNGFPSTTLPSSGTMYQLGFGPNGTVSPTFRYGLADDFEVAVTHSNSARREMAIETGVYGRWGLIPDEGKPGFAGALDLGLVRVDGQDLLLGYSLYADAPLSYRLPGNKLTLQATPKVIIPAQFQGVPKNLSVSLGATWQVAENTQIFGNIAPPIIGDNQLVAGKSFAMSGRTPVYGLGIRQLFPNGNSTYGVELYYTNAAGSNGFQAVSALPNGDTQVGVKFSILNGTP
jgi:hypothetical protein